MKENKQFSIEFKGLKDSVHSYEFWVDSSFFEAFEQSEIRHGKLHVAVEMDKKPDLMTFRFFIEGTVELQCDRCLSYFDKEIQTQNMLYVNFGQTPTDITDVDDTLTITAEQDRVELSQHIYEYIMLSLPVKRTHAKIADCDPQMLEEIDKHQPKGEQTDPRWDKLKSMLN